MRDLLLGALAGVLGAARAVDPSLPATLPFGPEEGAAFAAPRQGESSG
jgi:hypothetical protein